MNIREFAEKHRLKTRRDECGDTIIPGKDGHIWQDEHGKLGVFYSGTPKKWGNRRRAGEKVGMTGIVDGDFEGLMSFDPTNKSQASWAINIAKCRQKRVLSEEQRKILAERLDRVRPNQSKHTEEGSSTDSSAFLDGEAA